MQIFAFISNNSKKGKMFKLSYEVFTIKRMMYQSFYYIFVAVLGTMSVSKRVAKTIKLTVIEFNKNPTRSAARIPPIITVASG